MANLSSWPGDTQTDDSGTGQDGTVWNEAWSDAAKASIEDQVHSAANPTVKPKAITDEVVAARGSKSSLTARLDVALNADGTPKPAAGQASESQLASMVGHGNWVHNDSFLIWAKGDTAAPTGYVLDTVTVQRCGTGLADTVTKVGPFCARLTRAGTDGSIKQYLMNTTSFAANGGHVKGETFGVGCWVKTSVASQARLRMYDGVTSTPSSYHTGSGDWEWISFTHDVSGSATELTIYLEIKGSNGDAYFSGLTVIPGDVPPGNWVPCRTVLGTIVWKQVGNVATFSDRKDAFRPVRMLLVQDVNLRAKTAPTGAALIVDVNVYDGSAWQSMFSTRPQIAADANRSVVARPDGTYAYRCIAPALGATFDDNELSWDIDQVGSGTVGADLTVAVRAMQYTRPQEPLLDIEDT